MKTFVVAPSARSQVILATLQQAVDRALDRKRRLGQYAVVWENGFARLESAPKAVTLQPPTLLCLPQRQD